MIPLLRSIAAVCFYALGTTFFVAYALWQSGIGGVWPLWWLQIADLPLLLSGAVFGGTSVVMSVEQTHGASPATRIVIGLPLALFILFLLYLTFSTLL
ncbi:MAG: hypothetical protein G01um101425_117 [Candidatus Peregrinibacteria bacterium Gr01-1014_25]|nr:MAG: hypothetical protein G01um101425_117 [Candidatus Peregrinibacteria bacterium Gr01-1014_25]